MSKKVWALVALFVLVGAVVLVACQPAAQTVEVTRVVTETITEEGQPVEVTRIVEQVVEVTAAPTEAPAQPKDLVICQSQEPETLYPYGGSMLASTNVQHAIFENYITTLSYDFQAAALEKLPSLEDGDAVLNSVEVGAGDVVLKADDTVGELAEGDVIKNSDGEEVTFDGTPVMMDQLVVDFTMKPTVWSDGTPVNASDSVYSFNLLLDPDTPSTKYTAERTASYEATGDLSTRWTGLPGFRDATYFINFWQPYPEHVWGAFSAAELLEAEESSRLPMGDGPFVIDEWIAGDSIRMSRNENYWRADEGLPYLDSVTFKFIPDTNQLLAQVLSGQCDIVPEPGLEVADAPFLTEAEASGLLVPYFQTGTTFQHIDFAVDTYGDYTDTRYDWFEDVRVRQAMTMCTDRQSMVDNLLFGRSEIIHTYIPSVHPLYPTEGLTEWPFDPEAANALLDEAGFLDTDGDGFRESPDGSPFNPQLGTTAGNVLRAGMTQIFKENQAACGIDVGLYTLPASEWFADGPEGPLFGRQYDLGLFAWLTGVQPACELYMGSQIPGPADEVNPRTGQPYGSGWGGQNNTGWNDPDYDAACAQALGSLPGTPEYTEAHIRAQQIFSEQVPVIPVFLSVKTGVTRPEVLNYGIDPTQNSHLYNIAEIDIQQ
ncbi:MAG: peptide ABC transporter substrate-binding protein [Anaerolineae bacterium]|uniref:peptide ABC transporter substrate-binding protein n=1 Tax=Promineifilum sp. TaxID=2664178 RepID=UPI001DCABC7B|nr:peptide ABC transporter substrate-binding protein [Anaerolineales bacterium]MCB8934100.1 peptide ABC transporter substrate-binding protein [Promineifilum sp.]MCO5179722.1 peptide ABC transporter substrate-binding protein [Promineifilum sp.]MCW5845718.1 peptide ABC transporter substrate-binding protein [Anaerolineae bacterium]